MLLARVLMRFYWNCKIILLNYTMKKLKIIDRLMMGLWLPVGIIAFLLTMSYRDERERFRKSTGQSK